MSSSEVSNVRPEWLNQQFFQNIFEKHYKNNQVKVKSFEIKPATGTGDSFTSSIYKVQVTVDVSTSGEPNDVKILNLIIKEATTDDVAFDVMSKNNVYNKEMIFYGEIAPKINEKLKKLGEAQLFPEFYGFCKSRNLMIMDDLSVEGYGLILPSRGYNINEAKAILKRLALFHASCAVVQEDHSDIFAEFKEGHIPRSRESFSNYYIGALQIVIEIISEWPDFVVYADKLRRLHKDVVELGRRTYDLNPSHFNSFNHDDLWCPNLMLKMNKGADEKPFENVMFIDFQFSYWSSPTTDLYYFLNTSMMETVQPSQFNELIQFYHGELTNYLKKLSYKKHIPSWQEFQQQHHERRFLGFIMSCLVQPQMINNTENLTIEQIVKNDENGMKAKRTLYKGEKIKNILRKFIPYYDQLHTFD